MLLFQKGWEDSSTTPTHSIFQLSGNDSSGAPKFLVVMRYHIFVIPEWLFKIHCFWTIYSLGSCWWDRHTNSHKHAIKHVVAMWRPMLWLKRSPVVGLGQHWCCTCQLGYVNCQEVERWGRAGQEWGGSIVNIKNQPLLGISICNYIRHIDLNRTSKQITSRPGRRLR